jgi:PAS domain S-box-containing protein
VILFTRLLLIIVVALLPPLGMQAFNESVLRTSRQADVRLQAERAARLVSSELARIAEGTRNTLAALAEVPAVRSGSPADCTKLLRAIAARFVFWRAMAEFGSDGRQLCGTAGIAPQGRADAPEIVLARARGDFAIGSYAVDERGQPVLPMGYPVPGLPGVVLVADIDLGWLRDQLTGFGLPPGSSLAVADRDGRLLVRIPDEQFVGTLMPPQFRWLLDQPKPGVMEGVGIDGVDRIVGYQPLSTSPADTFVSVGFSTRYAYAASDAASARGYALIVLGLVMALGVAGWLLRGTIARPVSAILATTERWRAGDIDARVTIAGSRSEFSRIADSINGLLDTIVENQGGLRARLAELDAVYRGAAVGLCFLDHDMRIVISNEALAEIDGIPIGEWRGRTIRELLPAVADQIEPRLRRALAGERIPPREVTGVKEVAPGVPRRLLVSYQPAMTPDGQVLGAVMAVQDITALRQAEAALQDTLRRANAELEARVEDRTRQLHAEIAEREAAQAQLQQAQKMEMLGQLTGGVAHDFNNLLTAVIGNLELAMARAADLPDVQRLLLSSLRAADRGTALTQRMLAFGRRQYLRIEPVEVGPLLQGMADMLARTIGPPIMIRIDAAERMAPAFADSNQVELLVLNLAVNARDAMPEGGTITIEAAEERLDETGADALPLEPGRYVRITVRDTGIGMDETIKARAFEPFFTTKAVGHGSGLGLSMVQGVAEQSGGAVAIESAPGQGTSVSVWLPCERRAAGAGADRAEGPGFGDPAGDPSGGPAGARLLLVEDDADVAASMATSLADAGYDVAVAEDGETALAILRAGPLPSLMIVDLGLRGISGDALIEEAQAIAPSLIVLIATGDDSGSSGAMRYPVLHKPFRAAELRARVAAMLPVAA